MAARAEDQGPAHGRFEVGELALGDAIGDPRRGPLVDVGVEGVELRLVSVDGRAPNRAFRDEKTILPSAVLPAGRRTVLVEVTRQSLNNPKENTTERLSFPVTVEKGKNYLLTIERGYPVVVEDTR